MSIESVPRVDAQVEEITAQEWFDEAPEASRAAMEAAGFRIVPEPEQVDPFEADASWPGWGDDEVTSELARRGDPAAEL